MICGTCGSQIPDNSVICSVCGQAFVYDNTQQVNQQDMSQKYSTQEHVEQTAQGHVKQTAQEHVEQTAQKHVKQSAKHPVRINGEDVKKIFSDTNEEYVTSLGNSYLQNFLLNGSLGKGFCTVSDKRVYFNGTTYNVATTNKGKKTARRCKSSKIIDLYDVTGTGTENIIDIFKLIIAYFLFVSTTLLAGVVLTIGIVLLGSEGVIGILPILCVGIFLLPDFLISLWIKALKTKTFIVIQYAGGEIAFDAKWYVKDEIDAFQKELRVAKDKALEIKEKAMANQLQNALQSNYSQNTVQAGNMGYSNPVSNADELIKYADLLDKGLISKEEFDSIKQQIISKI